VAEFLLDSLVERRAIVSDAAFVCGVAVEESNL